MIAQFTAVPKLVPAVAMRAVVLRHAAVAAEARRAIGGGMLANRAEPVAACDRFEALPAAASDSQRCCIIIVARLRQNTRCRAVLRAS